MKIYKFLGLIASAAVLSGMCTIGVSAEEASENIPDILPAESADIEIEKSGWVTDENGKTYYYDENGFVLTGLNEIDGDIYYFAPNGAMKNGWFTVDDIRMFFDLETGKRRTGWIDYMNETFYADSERGKLSGLNEIDGKTYIFNYEGILYNGWFEYNGSKYYSDIENGIYTGECTIDGISYVFSSKGKLRSGWQNVNGLRLFYDYDTAVPIYGWIHYNGLIYYSQPDRGKYVGVCDIDNIKYKFSEKGNLQTGFQKFDDGTRFYYEDGKIGTGFIIIGADTYYFGKDYLMETGFVTVEGKKYYFNNNGIMQYDWQTIEGKKYYFASDGVMLTGINKIGSDKYYFDDTGAMKTGFNNVGGKVYYFDPKGKMKYNWQTIDNKKYYLGSDGIMRTGWQKIDNKKYYFDKKGVMAVGWKTIDKNKYYFNKKGEMVSGIYSIDGKRYYFSPDNGMLLCNKTQDGITTNSSGVITKVLLDTPYVSQSGFPTGCESASAVMLLKDAGYSVSIADFIDDALDIGWLYEKNGKLYGPDPNVSFIGNPRSSNGYGCYAPVITNALNRILGNGDQAVNITGTSMSQLISGYIDKGIPVAVWATIGMIGMEYTTEWTVPETGELFTWKSNEHCLVLVGYDDKYYYMNDPYNGKGLCKYLRSVVEDRYAVMGYQAVVIKRN
ncbi:MAG: C39 family peptidase [Clostridium sp.]|nr:C39 family peptidase [Clostridium sp.]MCM1547315.1 C39 family peptidase [Ruminococcus sp.]